MQRIVAKKVAGAQPDALKLELYDKLVTLFPDVERKGVTMPYTSVNGNMFSFLDSSGILNIRLSESERAAFIKKYQSSLSIQHGVIMKEYVVVPNTLLSKTTELKKYFVQSYAYAVTLKAKPGKKK